MNLCYLLAGSVANCPLHGGVLYTEKHLGNNLLSIIWSNGVSALEGLCMYGSYRENNRDLEICPLYRGVRYRGVSVKRGFTVIGMENGDLYIRYKKICVKCEAQPKHYSDKSISLVYHEATLEIFCSVE